MADKRVKIFNGCVNESISLCLDRFFFILSSIISVLIYFKIGEPYPSFIGPGFPGVIRSTVFRQCYNIIDLNGQSRAVTTLDGLIPEIPGRYLEQLIFRARPVVKFHELDLKDLAEAAVQDMFGLNMHVLRPHTENTDLSFLCKMADIRDLKLYRLSWCPNFFDEQYVGISLCHEI